MTRFMLFVGLLAPTLVAEPNNDICRAVGQTAALASLPEASGLTVGTGSSAPLFAIGDSGSPLVTVLDQSGAVVRKVTLTGAQVKDWEAITTARCGGSSCLYVADIGDNPRSRASVTIYRVDEAAATRSESVDAEAFELIYPDGPHDAEAMFATNDGRLFLVTKERGRATIFRAPHPLRLGQRDTLSVATTVALPKADHPAITDAAASPDGKWIGLRSNDALLLYRASELLGQRTSTPIQIDLRAFREPQGEGIAFGPNGMVYLVGEGGGGKRPGSFVALRCALPQ
jgi:uncharacterized protein YjiK